MKLYLPTIVAIITGVIALLTYFFPVSILGVVRQWLLSWAVLLAAVALLVGVVGLVRVHGNRVLLGTPNWGYSSILLMGLFGVLVLYIPLLIAPFLPDIIGLQTIAPTLSGIIQFVFDYVQTPLEAALGALLAFMLVLAGVRLMRTRRNSLSAVVFLLFSITLLGCALFSPTLYDWITRILAVGGARGILLGMALGVVATGLRIILSADRPYGE